MRSDAGQGGVIGRGWLQDSEWGPGDPSNNQHTHSLLSFDDEDDGVPKWRTIKQLKRDDDDGGGDEDEVRGVHSRGMI